MLNKIMTGLEGNRQIYLLREIQDRLPKSTIDQGTEEVNINIWVGDPLKWQKDSLLPEGPLISFIIPLC